MSAIKILIIVLQTKYPMVPSSLYLVSIVTLVRTSNSDTGTGILDQIEKISVQNIVARIADP